MHITRVTLTNVKSYGDEDGLRFEQGVNLIKGENGAGKSTILEAIGYALFGYFPYKRKEEFVRQGQKKGEIVVRFIGADEREYEVIRGVGTSSKIEVLDVELVKRIATGAEDTVDCLRDLLNVGSEADLVSLFEDVIGVPQGTMTAIFTLPPTAREQTFNTLLRLESYRSAYAELSNTEKYIRGLLEQNTLEQATCQAKLDDLPEQELEFTRLQTDIHDGQVEQTANRAQLELLDAALKRSEASKAARGDAEQALGECQHQFQRLRDRLEAAKTDEHQAEEACKVLEETQSSYVAYQEAEQILQQLEDQRRERDGLAQERQRLENQLNTCATRIELLERQLGDCRVAASLLATLEPQVEKQSALEATLRHVQEAQKERNRLAQQIQEQAQRCDNLHVEMDELDGKLAHRQQLAETIQQLQQERDAIVAERDELKKERPPLADRLTSVQAALTQERERKTQYEQAQRDRARCAEQIMKQEALVGRLHQSVEKLTGLSHQIALLENERTTAQEDATSAVGERKSFEKQIATLQERRDLLDTGDAQCPVCQRPLDEHSRDDAARHYQGEFERLDAALGETMRREQTAAASVKRIDEQVKSLQEQTGKLDNEQALQRALDTLDQLRREFDGHDAEAQHLEDAPSTVEALAAQERIVQTQLLGLDNQQTEMQTVHERLTGQIDDQQRILNNLPQASERESKQQDYLHTRAELEKAQARFDQLAQVDEQINQLESEIAALDDPRSRFRMAQQTASKLEGFEAEQAMLVKEQTELQNEQANVLEQLAAFDGLDTAVVNAQQIKNISLDGYQRYLRVEGTAKLLEERQTIRVQLQHDVETAEQDYEAAQRDYEAAAQAYDAEAHLRATSDYQILSTRQAMLEALIEEKTKQLANVQDKLERLRDVQIRLAALEQESAQIQKEQSAFEFVRKSIRDAGAEVRTRLVKSIGQTATSIFGEIIGDYSPTLDWGSDYGITLTQKGETRVFRQLSGGEQMAAALSVRLALLTHMSQVRFIFLDEPTTNLDETRRDALATKLRSLRNVEQLFIISHDDTFAQDGVHQVEIAKEGGLSKVKVLS